MKLLMKRNLAVITAFLIVSSAAFKPVYALIVVYMCCTVASTASAEPARGVLGFRKSRRNASKLAFDNGLSPIAVFMLFK